MLHGKATVTEKNDPKILLQTILQPFCNPVTQLHDARQQREALFDKKRRADEEIASLSTLINEKVSLCTSLDDEFTN